MSDPKDELPESSAARVALWRALHFEADAPPPGPGHLRVVLRTRQLM